MNVVAFSRSFWKIRTTWTFDIYTFWEKFDLFNRLVRTATCTEDTAFFLQSLRVVDAGIDDFVVYKGINTFFCLGAYTAVKYSMEETVQIEISNITVHFRPALISPLRDVNKMSPADSTTCSGTSSSWIGPDSSLIGSVRL